MHRAASDTVLYTEDVYSNLGRCIFPNIFLFIYFFRSSGQMPILESLTPKRLYPVTARLSFTRAERKILLRVPRTDALPHSLKTPSLPPAFCASTNPGTA